MATPPGPERSKSSLSFAALVVGVVSACVPPLYLVTIVLAVLSLVRVSEEELRQRRGTTIAALLIPLLTWPVLLVLIGIPSFVRPTHRSTPDAECRSNLKAAYAGEVSLLMRQQRYSPHPVEVGFAPERGNRYLYRLAASGPVEDRSGARSTPTPTDVGIGPDVRRHPGITAEALERAIPPSLAAELGVQGACPACDVTIACAGNIDADPTIDVWSVSTRARTSDAGVPIPPGQPHREVNDQDR